ncbi:MAG: DUF1858 domain-containing protein [Lachnospiraceae bacterium]|jgi:hybrid cluster-associated redox disulfide protein|nr:DUF1858 domain-containing protein [Lachnospiraceae bacterium]
MFSFHKEEQKVNTEKITTDMLIGDILRAHPDAAFALMNCGMGCVSCPASQMESLEEACMVHGMDVDEVAEYVNAELGLA